jgi:peroxiredoxin
MLRSVRPPEPPAQLKPLLKNGDHNPAFVQWVRQHYWDNTDFNNETLLNNTFWQVYFDNFFSRHVAAQADSIIRAIDEVLAKTPRNGAFYRFITLRITQYYEQNEAPGADRIFVHMVDKFLKKQETPWLDQATLERLAYKADANRPNLTGSLAVNFTMPDETGAPVELYGIQAPYTVLIFYSPLCSHCMEIMPKMYQTFLDYRVKGLAALAINTDEEKEYWRKFVGQQNWLWFDVDDAVVMKQLEKQYNAANLPVIYILDKDKRILQKRVKPNELGAILGKYFSPKQ